MADWTSRNGVEVPDATPTGAAGLRLKDNFLLLADRALTSVACGRLTLESGVPISTADQTAKTTLYYTPYGGNEVSLYDAVDGYWKIYSFTQRSISVPAVRFMPFDVFLYDDSGTLTLETVNWASSQTTGSITNATNATPIVVTSTAHGRSNGDLVGVEGIGGNTAANGYVWVVSVVDANSFQLVGSSGNAAFSSNGSWYLVPTTRATALATQDSVYVKNSAAGRRYVGSCCTTDQSGQCEDSLVKRLVWNEMNRVHRKLLKTYNQQNWNYNSSTLRPADNQPSLRVSAMIGRNESLLDLVLYTAASSATAASAVVGIGEDSANANDADVFINAFSTTRLPVFAVLKTYPDAGMHFYQWVEKATSASTVDFYGEVSGNRLHGLVGTVLS